MSSEQYILVGGQLKEATVEEWSEWFTNIDNRRIGEDVIDGVRVSTVMIGVGIDLPILFESKIVGGPFDSYQYEYATVEEAKAGHKRLVKCVRMEVDPARLVAQHDIGDVRVSTVCLCSSAPTVYETMIMGGPFDSMACEYPTLFEAKWGHVYFVGCVVTGTNPEE